MTYRDTTQQPFVLIDVDTLKGADLSRARATVEAAKVYNPAVWWQDGADTFTGDIANDGQPGITLLPDEAACKMSLFAVKQIGRLRAPGSYVVVSEFQDVPAFERQSLIDALTSTIRNVKDGGGKRFILISSQKRLEKAHPGVFEVLQGQNPGIPRFEEDRLPAGSPGGMDFKSAIGSAPPPGFQDAWDWADNQDFMDQIERLTPVETQQLIRDRLHEPALQRLRRAMQETQKLFRNRERAVEMMVACGIARVNLVFLGPPGTAKSELVRVFARTLGVRPDSRPIREESLAASESRKAGGARGGRRLFEYLLTRYTTPEELFGSADVDLLLNKGLHGRRTEGMLPQAEIGFLDELFKANTAILNALLSLTNERLFYNMGQAFKVNQLAFVVGASNETPAEEELGALYDRFPIRVPCLPVTQADLGEIIQLAHLDRENVPRYACLNDMRLLSKVAWAQESLGGANSAFPAKGGFKEQFLQLLTAFREEFHISDRTPYRLLRLCRALAVLDGANTMGPMQLRAWGYVAPRVSSALDLQQLVRKRLQQWDERCEKLFDSH